MLPLITREIVSDKFCSNWDAASSPYLGAQGKPKSCYQITRSPTLCTHRDNTHQEAFAANKHSCPTGLHFVSSCGHHRGCIIVRELNINPTQRNNTAVVADAHGGTQTNERLPKYHDAGPSRHRQNPAKPLVVIQRAEVVLVDRAKIPCQKSVHAQNLANKKTKMQEAVRKKN